MTDSTRTALADMDAQHRELLGAVEQFDNSSTPPVQRLEQLLAALERQCVEHFGHEERLMTEHHYPDVAAHTAVHALVRSRVEAVRARFRVEGPTDAVVTALRETVGAMLHDQMVSHDRALKKFLTAR